MSRPNEMQNEDETITTSLGIEEMNKGEIEAAVARLGEEIRQDKSRMQEAGCKKSGEKMTRVQINEILAPKIEKLKALKARLPDDSKHSKKSFDERKANAEKEKQKRLTAEKEEQTKRRQKTFMNLGATGMPSCSEFPKSLRNDQQQGVTTEEDSVDDYLPMIQRKLYHMFSYEGNSDRFRYVGFSEKTQPSLNLDQITFNTSEEIVFTEKWDGTTMQATRDAVFKRLDTKYQNKKGRGKNQSRNKKGQTKGYHLGKQEYRYDLSVLCWWENDDELGKGGGKWFGLEDHTGTGSIEPSYVSCLRPYLERFRQLEPGLCVYFEACHNDIGLRYRPPKNIDTSMSFSPCIRVFDFTFNPALSRKAWMRHKACLSCLLQNISNPPEKDGDLDIKAILSETSANIASFPTLESPDEYAAVSKIIAGAQMTHKTQQHASNFTSFWINEFNHVLELCKIYRLPAVAVVARLPKQSNENDETNNQWTAEEAYCILSNCINKKYVASEESINKDFLENTDTGVFLEGFVAKQANGAAAKARVEYYR